MKNDWGTFFASETEPRPAQADTKAKALEGGGGDFG